MSKPYYLKLLSPAVSKPLKVHTFTCERCGKKFDMPFWYIKKGRRFCNKNCVMQDPLKTLMSRCRKRDDGCWDYTGFLGWGGYGQLKVGKKDWLAHRLMWTLTNKKRIPLGMVVRHTCIGNRKCINPDHLILGTPKENVHDTIRQGRFGRPHNERFTPELVRKIRAVKKSVPGSRVNPSYREVARMFNTTDSAIWNVVNRKTYKHIM